MATERVVSGARAQFLSPFWQVLESKRPLSTWQEQIAPRLVGHLFGGWNQLIDQQKISAPQLRRWMRAACRYELLDALCLLSGVCLLLIQRGDEVRAQVVAESMIRAMLIEHTKFPIAPFVGHLYEACKKTIWEGLSKNYFRGYDFRVASSAAVAIASLRSMLGCSPSDEFDAILLPGKTWTSLSEVNGAKFEQFSAIHRVPSVSGTQYFDLPAKFLRKTSPQLKRKSWDIFDAISAESVAEQVWLLSLASIYGWQLVRRPPSTNLEHTIRLSGYSNLNDDLVVVVTFIGRYEGDDQWIEASRKLQSWKLREERSWLFQQLDLVGKSSKRQKFEQFPRKTRIFHFGKNFRSI